MPSGRQFRLLLWKDYLIRKRKPVTLAGILWASLIMLSLYIVRINVDNQDFPTCTFPARALPSAGVLTFMQSLICSVNNDCSPMDQFQEIPTYEDSKFTQLQRKFAPLLNESMLEVAAAVPDALKLLATLADIVDEPTFVDITKHGLKVEDLFNNPARVRRYVASQLKITDDVAQSVMVSQLSFQGITKGDINRCSTESLSKTVSFDNSEHLNIIVSKLCSLSNKDVHKMFMDLLMEINFSKYIKMIGSMYAKLSGDDRISTIGDMFTAVVRMMKMNSFLPAELVSVVGGEGPDFSYFNVSLISKLMDLFEPTFGNTQAYKSTRDFTDTAVISLQYLDKILAKQTQSVSDDTGLVMANAGNKMDIDGSLQKITKMFGNAIEVFEQSMDQDVPIDAFNIFTKLTNIIYKWLSEKTKHDVLFYSTLLAKLLESSQTVIDNNMNIEELSYVVTLRNPEGLKVLLSLPPGIVGKGLEALADAERTQILTSKINFPGQMFCDLYKLQSFFVISKTEAESLKKQLCTDAWKNYVSDLIRSFGIFEVRNNINKMASLLIQETLGKDTSDQLYTIEEDFKILKNFTEALTQFNSGDKTRMDWKKLLNVTEESPFMKVVRAKGHLGKQMLITVHGALAKEVVKQNPILEYKLSPVFMDATTLLEAMNDQIATTPVELVVYLKKHYADVVRTVLLTSLDEDKTYKSLSTHSTTILCNGVEKAASYVEFPSDVFPDDLVASMCNTSIVIEDGMNRDSLVARAIRSIKNTTHTSQQLNWTKLINNVKDLYIMLGRDYPYLFEFSTYGMDKEMQAKVSLMAKESKEFWFSKKSLQKSLHLCIKLGFRFLDILDADIFDITNEMWMKVKFSITTYSGPLRVFDDSLKLVTALITNTSYTSPLPPRTVAAMSNIVPNIPQLIIDTLDLVVNDSTDVAPIISIMNSDPPWPCATTSLSDLLTLTSTSKDAIRAIEMLICLDVDLQDEWVRYLGQKNVTVSSTQKWNTTQFEPHLFLKLSSIFDSLIEDAVLVKDSLEEVFKDSDEDVTLTSALKYAVQVMNTTERDSILRKALNKMDTVLNAIDTSAVNDSVPLNALWESFVICSNGTHVEKECLSMGRATWTNTFKTMSVIFENIANDLLTYFREVNDPNANLLQMLGFTRNTGLYVLYDKMPEFIGVLLNSYWDYGFMNQIRRASLSQFWDCEEVLRGVAPPLGSPILADTLRTVKPYACPTLLHWISMPRGDNVLLDVVAKPQYYFYVLPTQNISSGYENAYTKAIELADYITEITTKNQTLPSKEDIKLNSIQGKLERMANNIISYQINETDPSYKLFNEINKKQFQSTIYLTRIVAMVNKIGTAIEELKFEANNEINEEDLKQIQSDHKTIKTSFMRRPVDAIAFHFDVLTDLLWTDRSNYTIIDALDTACVDLKSNDVGKVILDEEKRLKKQVCAKSYKAIYGGIQAVLEDDYKDARQSLVNLIDVMKSGDSDDVTNVFKFFNDRKQLILILKKSITYSYDLTLPIYLKYLQSNLQHYDVILSFLAGTDWWGELMELYHGPHAGRFFGYLERSFEITEDVLTNLDRIHLVRLLRDINVNRTDAFCQPNITLSEYMPDRYSMFANLKNQICATDNTELLKEIPPLVFASQGYNNALTLSKDINYTSLYSDISKTESRLGLIKDGPMAPMRPQWVTEDKLKGLRDVALRLLSKETLTKLSFGIMSNLVDGGTLFLNDSQCTICSQFTTWFKQLNLQLFKKQEYDNLLCHMSSMSLRDIYETLNNDFHWDMTIRELISTRNYTKYEMNKSMVEFLELVKLHLLEDMAANTTKLTECLANNVTRNEFGNATLLLSVLAHIAKLLRSEMYHLHTVEGIKDVPYLQSLRDQISHNLDVMSPLDRYLKDNHTLINDLLAVVDDDNIVDDVGDASIDLRMVLSASPPDFRYMRMRHTNWEHICETNNCTAIMYIIDSSLNKTRIERVLPKLESEEFWRFPFMRNILEHTEGILSHGSRLLGVGSKVDVVGVANSGLAPLVDMMMLVLADDTVDTVRFSLQGILEELHPLLMGTELEFDLGSLSAGLHVLHQFKTYLVEEQDLKVAVSSWFPNPEGVERGLGSLGINNTNFWSIAAPRIHAGHINLMPILSSKGDYHITDYVCQVDYMSKVLLPSNLDVVTADDVYGAVLEQFCGMPDQQAKEIIPVLLENFNFTVLLDKVTNILLTKLYVASNLTQEEGSAVLSKYPQMTSLVPVVQDNIGDLSESLASEPLFQNLKNFTSVGGLLGSSEFVANAGVMLCGKPFNTNMNRMYATIAATPDLADQPDQAQLDVLPTDFCRSLYRDILSIKGGKIVWSFVKPLIMGKILFTPSNPVVDAIIEKANATFSQMWTLTNLVHSFARSFSSVERLSIHREGLAALRTIMTAPHFEQFRLLMTGADDDGGDVPNVDVDGLFDEFGDLKDIGGLLNKASDLLQCINLNRFKVSSDEDAMTREAASLSRLNEFSAGLVFLNTEDRDDIPMNIEYKIRMDIDNAPTTSRKKNYLWIPGPESNFIENMRYFRGFIQIQDIIDKAIIQLSRSRVKRETRTEDDVKWAVYTQQVPYPCYRKDFFQTSLYESQALIVAFFFSLLFTVASAVRFIVTDYESGNTMLMSVMGVDLRYHTLSWLSASLLEMCLTCGGVTLVLHLGQILPRTDPTLVFALLFVFGLSVLSFCYMMSKMFSSASFGAVCAAIAYLVTFMPFIIILSLEAVLTTTLKMFVCLSMSSALCYSLLYITRYEAMGIGAGWGSVTSPGGEDMSIALAAAMMLADAVLYWLIGCLIDRFFGPKTLRSNITNCVTSGEKAGVSIVNISKVFGDRVALDNVSIELHQGQITTLLGHNGAGKTTLINILTGMLKPSKGHVIIRSEHSSGARLGVCPQKDVLFEYMTAREHLALYAQLKSGLPLEQVQDEVDKMMAVVSCGAGEVPAARLSGGTRRRVCVALAFLARPHLVSLDEPTAGVDPAARRDIWSMIMNLKEDRTILLTTHHLDEAELLSDQIVIMHKGQIHTTGSPIEIKRTLGSGYKLTVMYDTEKRDWTDTKGDWTDTNGDWTEPNGDWTDAKRDWTEADEDSIEEKTKRLVTFVRDTVKNASVVDVNGAEVEILLPFFDDEGVHNNYLQLCTLLEGSQPLLGYRSYTLDCTSLEQVFFNICHQADTPHQGIQYVPETPEAQECPSKSTSTSSIKTDRSPLVPADGPLSGTLWAQFLALMYVRYLHHIRNRQLLFMLVVLPSLFVSVAMGFSTLRPPTDNEVSLPLNQHVYEGSTQFLVPTPSIYSKHIYPMFAQRVMYTLQDDIQTKNWTSKDSPTCKCIVTRQECDIHENELALPEMMLLPDVDTLNTWLVDSQEIYIEKRYTGFTSSVKDNRSALVAWYNNKGHHAMPAALNQLNTAILRTLAGDHANITTYTHPFKISKEQISKDTIYQHIADAGISGLVLLAYSLVSAGGAVYLVSARRSQEKRLQLLCGVPPALYWATALCWDMIIILINIAITAVVMKAFGFPVFVARNNLPAICLLLLVYGYACGCLVHVAEKLFTEASLANMMLFCGNAFIGLSGLTVLLIMDIISESDATDNARWMLHKIFMLSPQFALGDGLLEIAKNTIQAQVLSRFGMDTYRDPLSTDLVLYHYVYLAVVGTALLLLNLAIEYDCFEVLLVRLRSERIPARPRWQQAAEVTAERARVLADRAPPLTLNTIGNINRGFVHTEGRKNSVSRGLYRQGLDTSDVVQCVGLSKVYPTLHKGGHKVAVRDLTMGIPAGQCTALLGANGAGKSSTFSMLTGETRPSQGQLYLHDHLVTSRQLCTGLISYCPQSDAIDPLLTVKETLTFYCRLRGISDHEEVIKRVVEMFELGRYSAVWCGALSGGNKRKVCAAIAFAGRAPLVLLDEPTSGMDPVSRWCVHRGVHSACGGGASRAVLLSTHALTDARKLATRLAFMCKGELRAIAPIHDCLDRFGGGYVVQCRVSSSATGASDCSSACSAGGASGAWSAVQSAAPHAQLTALHTHTIHFLLPAHYTVDEKETTTRLSDVFRLMSKLQESCDIEDFTVNQSSLDQMFLSITDKVEVDPPVVVHPTPSPTPKLMRSDMELHSVTSL